MKFIKSSILTIFLTITLVGNMFLLDGCGSKKKQDTNEKKNINQDIKEVEEVSQDDENKNTEEAVLNLVEEFGSKLQFVSLLASKDDVEKSMKENYSEFVSEDLLKNWIDEPINAPGRFTSSPWPDRIEIENFEKIDDNSYQVEGKIIEITNVEKEKKEATSKRSITLLVKRIKENWQIEEVTLEDY